MFRRSQMRQTDRGYFPHAEELCCHDPAMAGENCMAAGNENGVGEAEARNAVRKLADLALRMRSRIAGIGSQRGNWPLFNSPGRAFPIAPLC